jgi:NTP pyrophosphatase (non-canonical NTP hydrolase)
MDIKEFQKLSKRTMGVPVTGTIEEFQLMLCNYAMGLGGESGEVQDVLKKWIHHKHPYDEMKLIKEMGDLMHYWCGICTMLHLDIDEIFAVNLQKLKERYPDGFSADASMERKDVTNE